MPDGELAPGAWGEGFVDRRHPHTYVHEVVLTYADGIGRSAGFSLSAGKGFAPFGTDDPMSRPIFRYPVNHHLAQILERAVAILGIRAGPLLVEAGLFNGDEPERPGQWPRISRFGDSWSARVTLLPMSQLELQARTSEANGFYVFQSVLAEGAWTWGRSRLHYRFERTDRPEKERTLSPFRSVRPHFENSILGETRWTILTAGYGFRLQPVERVGAVPFVELSYGRIADMGGGLFDARSFYGKTSFWSVSVGTRLTLGMPLHRMGRYGIAQDRAGRSARLSEPHGH